MNKQEQLIPDFLELAGKTLVVTGASSGIGKKTATLAAELGAKVALIGRAPDRLANVFGSLAGEGHVSFSFDLADVDAVPVLAERVLKAFGHVDGIIHAAGTHLAKPVRTTSREELTRVFELNVYSPFFLCQAFRNQIRDTNGLSIVFISSAATFRGSSGISAYSSSKAAVEDLAKTVAAEWAKDGIRSNAVAAGMVDTPMSERIRTHIGAPAWDRVTKEHPLGLGHPLDVARAALFLVSPAASWMTGSVLRVDGGYAIA